MSTFFQGKRKRIFISGVTILMIFLALVAGLYLRQNFGLDFFSLSTKTQKSSTEFWPSCISPQTAQLFISELSMNAPAFSALQVSIGLQPSFDENGNVLPEKKEQFTQPYYVILRSAALFNLDPRILVVLSEMSTYAVSAPQSEPSFPFAHVNNYTGLDLFVYEYNAVAQQVQQRIQSISTSSLQDEERSVSAISQGLEEYFLSIGVDPGQLPEKRNEFRTVLQQYFPSTDLSCGE